MRLLIFFLMLTCAQILSAPKFKPKFLGPPVKTQKKIPLNIRYGSPIDQKTLHQAFVFSPQNHFAQGQYVAIQHGEKYVIGMIYSIKGNIIFIQFPGPCNTLLKKWGTAADFGRLKQNL